MIHGIGTDILSLERLRGLDGQWDDAFFRAAFTPAERAAAGERAQPLLYYADRFAGKEAVFKALRLSPEGVRLNEIEILDDAQGRPGVTLHGQLRVQAGRAGISAVHLSLSYEADTAIAFAVCEK